jgi:hypothetical protein
MEIKTNREYGLNLKAHFDENDENFFRVSSFSQALFEFIKTSLLPVRCTGFAERHIYTNQKVKA